MASGSWFLAAPPTTAALPVVVTEIGASDWRAGDHAARARSDILAVEWVLVGEIAFDLGGARHRVPAGAAFLLRPGERHRYACAGDRARKHYLGLAGAWAGGLLAELPPVIAGIDLAAWEHGFRALRRLLARPDAQTAGELSAVAYRLLLGLVDRRDDARRDPVLTAALARLDRASGSTVDVAGLARVLGVSRAVLHRRFRAALGTTPLRYWQTLQVRRAQGLLIGSSLPVKAVAARLGYGDPLYFSTVFHRIAGCSPSAWRARHRRN